MFRERHRQLRFESGLGPSPSVQLGHSQPAHVDREVLQAAEEHVGGDGTCLEHGEDMVAAGVVQASIEDRVQGGLFAGEEPTIPAWSGLHVDDGAEHHAPCARCSVWIARSQVHSGELKIEGGTIRGVVLVWMRRKASPGSVVLGLSRFLVWESST